jgi:hypothetical protein
MPKHYPHAVHKVLQDFFVCCALKTTEGRSTSDQVVKKMFSGETKV